MNSLQTVSKVALVPLSKLEKFQKCVSTDAERNVNTGSLTVFDSSDNSLNKRRKISEDVNFRKALKLNEMVLDVVNDETLGDDERLRKLLSALRHFIIFRDKSLAYQTQQQKQIGFDKKESSKDQPILSPERVVNRVSATPGRKEDEQYEGDYSPTRSLIKLEPGLSGVVNFEGKNIVSQLKGAHKSRGLELIDTLKRNPDFDWNEGGNISIKGKNFPSSNIKDLVEYEIIKYTKKGKEQLIPRNYDLFFNFLKSQNISPHKTSRESRAISIVGEQEPKSVRKQLEFDRADQGGEMVGEGFGSHNWDSY
jgi:hypothetical protein